MVNGNANARFLLDLLPNHYNYYMKYLLVSCILFFCTLKTFSQQEYFTYLQTENSQPFYIRLNKNVYSSTSSGYLIVSKLTDTTTTLSVTIGFAKSIYPEQQFNIPVSHKDAGYVIKNLGDKGWALSNLQTQAVIMSASPPEEKKKSELTGEKKNDAFSLLLANAVNDTAVLYTVSKPPKPLAPPVIIVTEEKKNDSVLLAKKELTKKDSVILVKQVAEKSDTGIIAKNGLKNDSSKIAVTHKAEINKPVILTKNKDAAAVAKNATHPTNPAIKNPSAKKDSALIAKNVSKHAKDTIIFLKPPAANDSVLKKIASKKDSALIAGNAQRHKKDSIIVTGSTHVTAAKEQPIIAKNVSKHVKDTIIMMSGTKATKATKAADNKVAVNNTSLKKEATPVHEPAKDTSIVIRKEIMQAPEEKRDALLNNRDAVIVEKLPAKKNTTEIIAKPETPKQPETRPDSIASIPVKRLRPLITKAAELLTDTSYVAVFVDESKDKFDTIRISIPFNEQSLYTKKEKAVDSTADKIKDSTLPIAINPPAQALIKIDSANVEKVAKYNAVAQQNITTPIKTDSIVADKKINDSSADKLIQKAPASIVKPDTAEIKQAKDSAIITHESSPPAIIKKDSVMAAAPDTVKTAKAPPPQALFLNSECKEIALDADIDKLRIKMLVVTSDEDRIALAKKLFKQKCFLVKHVRALSELFKTDEGKYKWFDATYSFVSDTGNFSLLSDLIKDEYYFNRFKAMLRH
jgi:hypothetical protein